jgi:hypothetical protein
MSWYTVLLHDVMPTSESRPLFLPLSLLWVLLFNDIEVIDIVFFTLLHILIYLGLSPPADWVDSRTVREGRLLAALLPHFPSWVYQAYTLLPRLLITWLIGLFKSRYTPTPLSRSAAAAVALHVHYVCGHEEAVRVSWIFITALCRFLSFTYTIQHFCNIFA